MPSLPDGIVIFVLALLLFGPKKLPVLARELGKWIGEFRRASNEFKMQMEEELRVSEQADKQKEIAAMEAAAPVAALPGVPTEEPEHPHMPAPMIEAESETDIIPIATSGELSIMPPATGLPVARSAATADATPETEQSNNIQPLFDSIPAVAAPAHTAAAENMESAAHG